MSTNFAVIDGTGKDAREMTLTAFAGPNGRMMQVTQGACSDPDDPGYIQLTRRDAYDLSLELLRWIKESSEEDAKWMQDEIDKTAELKATVFQDVVECAKFIQYLELADIPLQLIDTFAGGNR